MKNPIETWAMWITTCHFQLKSRQNPALDRSRGGRGAVTHSCPVPFSVLFVERENIPTFPMYAFTVFSRNRSGCFPERLCEHWTSWEAAGVLGGSILPVPFQAVASLVLSLQERHQATHTVQPLLKSLGTKGHAILLPGVCDFYMHMHQNKYIKVGKHHPC